MSSFPKEFQRYKDETKEEYLKRLNKTAFRCASCNRVFADAQAYKPGYAICKACRILEG